MNPLVSVVIAVYNGEKYIRETIDSLLSQTLIEWECWIVNDGSTDSTEIILAEYATKDSRFNILETRGGNGPYICANIAIPYCKAEFIARIDADDIAMPERLEIQYDLLSKNSKINLVGSYFFYLLQNGKLKEKPFETDPLFLKWQLLFRNRLVHSTMMFRKSWFIKIGMYPKKRLAQDWYIWVEGVNQDCLYIIRKPLIKWRIHQQSITKNESGKQLQHAADVSLHAVGVLLNRSSKSELLLPVISAMRGKPSDDPIIIEESLRQLITLWKDFLSIYMPKKKDAKKLRDEFIYFGFYLLSVNSKVLKNQTRLLLMLCKTEFNLGSVKWLFRYFRRKFSY